MYRRATQYGTAAIAAVMALLPATAFAQAKAFTGANNFSQFMEVFWLYASHIIFTLSVLSIITGGIIYVSSAGIDTRIDAAKEVIKGALISIFLVIISGYAIRVLTEEPGKNVSALDRCSSGYGGYCGPFDTLRNISAIFIGFAGAFTLVMLMINGFKYATSNGDIEKVGEARKGVTYSVLGLIICVTAYLIVKNVIRVF